MESPKPVSLSNKRVFPGGSASAGFKDVEVLEISPPPINRSSKPKSSKQKEKMIYHDIIDADMIEDCGDTDISRKDKEVICPEIIDADMEEDRANTDRSRKHLEELSNLSAGVANLASGGSGSKLKMSKNGTVEDYNSNLFYGDEDWIDKYFDDIIFEEPDALESVFDHMDIPSGVEAPFPWLPGSPQNNMKIPVTGTSTGSGRKKSTTSRGKDYMTSQPSSGGSLPHNPGNYEPLHSSGKSKRKSHHSSNVYSNLQNQFPSGVTNTLSGYPTLSMPYSGNGSSPVWPDFPLNGLGPSMGPSAVTSENAFTGSAQDSAKNQNEAPSAGAGQNNVDEIPKNSYNFKNFDTVEDYSDHYYSSSGSSAKYAQKNWAKRIQEEWKILENDLPDTIFVRVYESRMDLLRAVIIGAEGTPYHDGLFFFDVHFPSSYPNVPPLVHYHSGGLRINPNLYKCGKVCLSLLNTWSGGQEEKWIPGVSTMLQVLVSIQGLILNAEPYFNEPGYASTRHSLSGEQSSLAYSENTFIFSLQTMVYSMRRPPKHFEAMVVSYFCQHARDILKSCQTYLEGAQVGSLVKGGVKGVAKVDGSCSQNFQLRLARYITTVVNAFTQIGAKDCQEFLSLSQKVNGAATAGIIPSNSYY